MSDFESNDRQALGIFSDTINARLGPNDGVAKEVHRAYVSGREIDRFMARSAFDALPGWQRSVIGAEAASRAERVQREQTGSTERDWREMEALGRGRADPVVIPTPPKFLMRRRER